MLKENKILGLGLSQWIIIVFLIVLLVAASLQGMSVATLLSNSLVRIGMNAIFVLAMLPAIQSGIGLNFGLPIGIVFGLLSGLITVEIGMTGMAGFLAACLMAIVMALAAGYGYGLLLNRMRGSEMMVGNYLNFSVISLMCIAWMVLPFKNGKIIWAMGSGVRSTITLEENYEKILDNLWSFDVFGITIPSGMLLLVALLCLVMWLFVRSKAGIMMSSSGSNPMFGAAIGIDNDRVRMQGTILSTVLGAVGILVYSQSFGFYQLYNAPIMMAYPAISAILIGGATTKRATIGNVIVGAILYQAILTIALPVASEMLSDSSLSEILRTIVSNGIILYALTKLDGGKAR